MKKKSQKYIEIRAILIGLVRYEGLYCVAAENARNVVFSGLNNGATAARILGLRKKERIFESSPDSSYNIEQLYEGIAKKIKHTRRFRHQLVYIMSEPDTLAFMIRPVLTNPVVVTLIPQKNIVNTEIYTARTLFSGIHLRRMIKYFGTILPDGFRMADKKEKKDEK